jgi:hypothetical protein
MKACLDSRFCRNLDEDKDELFQFKITVNSGKFTLISFKKSAIAKRVHCLKCEN